MTAFDRQLQRVTDTDGLLLFLSVTHPDFSGPMNVVNDTRDWVSQGVTYIGLPFRFTLPSDTTGQTPRAVLEMDNVGRGLTEELEKLGPNAMVKGRLMIASRATPSVIEKSFNLPMTHVSVSGAMATAQLGVDFMMRQQAVKLRFNDFTAPGIN